MNDLLVILALKLVTVRGLDGHVVMVNPRMITTLTARKTSPSKLVSDKVNCIIGFADGKFLSVTESCDAVRKLMEGS